MKNLIWRHNLDIGRVFPQSFDISDERSEEFKDFREDFKFTGLVSFLNTVNQAAVSFTKNNFEKVMIGFALAERRVLLLSGKFLEDFGQADSQFVPSDLDTISDGLFEYLTKPNASVDLARTAWFRPLKRKFAEVKPADLKTKVSEVLD